MENNITEYTVKQAALLLGRSEQTVKRWIRQGRLPARNGPGQGRPHLIQAEAVENFTPPKPGRKPKEAA